MNETNNLAAQLMHEMTRENVNTFADIYEQMEKMMNRKLRRAQFANKLGFGFSLIFAWTVYSVLKDEIKELKKENEEK